MRTLVVTHYFPPETGAPQARLSELAATWKLDRRFVPGARDDQAYARWRQAVERTKGWAS